MVSGWFSCGSNSLPKRETDTDLCTFVPQSSAVLSKHYLYVSLDENVNVPMNSVYKQGLMDEACLFKYEEGNTALRHFSYCMITKFY